MISFAELTLVVFAFPVALMAIIYLFPVKPQNPLANPTLIRTVLFPALLIIFLILAFAPVGFFYN